MDGGDRVDSRAGGGGRGVFVAGTRVGEVAGAGMDGVSCGGKRVPLTARICGSSGVAAGYWIFAAEAAGVGVFPWGGDAVR